MTYWTVPLMWKGRSVAVVGGSELSDDEIAHLRSRDLVVVTNDRFRLFPQAAILVAIDSTWWWANPDVSEFKGLKVSTQQIDGHYPNVPSDVLVLKRTGIEGYEPRPDSIRTGTNSGYSAVHIAAQAGASEIELYGFSMMDDRGRAYHRWIRSFELLRIELARIGTAVINKTPRSAIRWP